MSYFTHVMHMCAYVCVCTDTHICTHTQTHVHTVHVHTCRHTHICMHRLTHIISHLTYTHLTHTYAKTYEKLLTPTKYPPFWAFPYHAWIYFMWGTSSLSSSNSWRLYNVGYSSYCSSPRSLLLFPIFAWTAQHDRMPFRTMTECLNMWPTVVQ